MPRFSSPSPSFHIVRWITLTVVLGLTSCCVLLTEVWAISDRSDDVSPFVGKDPVEGRILNLLAAKNASGSKTVKAHLTIESHLFEMTNQERVKNRLKPLALSATMNELAVKHSSDMCAIHRLAHESDLFPIGRRKFAERMKSIGLDSGAENIAYHSHTVDIRGLAGKIVDGWMNSPNHKGNILSERFTLVGYGTSVCKDGMIYVTQLFTEKPAQMGKGTGTRH